MLINSIREEWLNRYQGKTRKQAKTSLNAFDLFVNANHEGKEEIIFNNCKSNEDAKYIILDNLVQYWYSALELWPTTIRNYFSFIRAYFRRNGIKTDEGDIKDYVKFPKHIEETREPLTVDEIKNIISVSNKKYIALWYFQTSSGMRIGETLEARVNWLDYTFYDQYDLIIVKIPAYVTKGKRERFTFITRQAYQSLKPYLDTKLTPTARVFDISYGSVEEYFQEIRDRLDMKEKYTTGFYKKNIHSFRSFAETTITDHSNPEFSHFLLGHRGYLKYYRKSYEDSAKLYKTVEPFLTL